VANTYDDTCGGVVGLDAALEFVDLNNNRALVGAIELNREETSWLFKHCVAIWEWMTWP
jgi:hypothetical protein